MVSHAMTDAMAAVRFAADEPLNDAGRRQAEAVAGLDIRGARQIAGPELRARQTAQLLGLDAVTEPRLADLDCGRWRGQTLEAVPAADLEAWRNDPAQAPHGGESIVELTERVAGWLASLTEGPSRTVAITHPGVIRAAILTALDTSPKSFWRIDIAPLSRTTMHYRNGRWTLRLQ
ncbi:histidine phosphatase family protein [Mycobacterium ahvazicum]|uniref:Histidine phosphatase family protein n=2 Tax=Mycobacterium ahvazicum TaxID=1964395 RepID=A0A2K4YHQ4_9MYCO|nr:histidine phosphatase family protein [Mycobacterium ahvazicum]